MTDDEIRALDVWTWLSQLAAEYDGDDWRHQACVAAKNERASLLARAEKAERETKEARKETDDLLMALGLAGVTVWGGTHGNPWVVKPAQRDDLQRKLDDLTEKFKSVCSGAGMTDGMIDALLEPKT